MSDALSRNEANEAMLIRCHCLYHGRRKFSDIEETFPEACDVVMTALKDVFDHEEVTQKEHMSDAERLTHHQTYSEPILTTLKKWMKKQFEEREVEPNSSLGKAFTYILSHWQTLTQFLRVPGAPIDNNTAEVRFVGQKPGFLEVRGIGPRRSSRRRAAPRLNRSSHGRSRPPVGCATRG